MLCCVGIVTIAILGAEGAFSAATLDSRVPHAVGLGMAALYCLVAVVAYLRSRAMRRRAFTLVELLVTITIISILAGMILGALHAARNSAREAATKATIAKLNTIIMRRSRVVYDATGTDCDPARNLAGRRVLMRLNAIRDLNVDGNAGSHERY